MDGTWATVGNWTGGVLPGITDTVTFGDVTNQDINLGANRTVAGMTFTAADAYSFTGNTLTISGTEAFNGTGTVTFDSKIAIGAAGALFQGTASSGMVTINDVISGTGTVTFSGGNYTLLKEVSTYTGTTTISDGAVVNLTAAAGKAVEFGSNTNSFFGKATSAITIDGGTLNLIVGGTSGTDVIGSGGVERTIAFGQNGGRVDFQGKTNTAAAQVFSFQTYSGTPNATPVVHYGYISKATNGWDKGGNALQVGDNTTNPRGLIGSGPIIFDLATGSQGALLELNKTDQYSGTLTIRGVVGGDSSVANTAFNVSRVELVNDPIYAFSWVFENAVQVSNIAGNSTSRVIDGHITLAAGADVAFEGRPDNSPGTLTLGGTTIPNETLTIDTGAQANMDVGYRTDSLTPAGVILQMATVIAPGGTLRFRQSAAGLTPKTAMQLNGNVTGQGTSASDALFDEQINVGTGNGQLTVGAGSNFIVNGTGLGGLRIQGTDTRLGMVLTTTRVQAITGSGGAFTIAPTGTMTISTAPTAANNAVKLGLAASGTGATFTLGAATNDLANWAGLVVKPSSGSGTTTVTLAADESLTSGAGVTTTLDITGGTLNIGTRNLTVEGLATLSGGTLLGTTGLVTASSFDVQTGTISAKLAGSGSLGKTTSGTVTLSGSNTYTGPTRIYSGVLQVSASGMLGPGLASVDGGARLTNDGTISGNVIVDGTMDGDGTVQGSVTVNSGGVLAPGDSVGRISTGTFSAPSGATLQLAVAGLVAGVSHDQLRVTGSVALGGILQLSLLPAYVPTVGDRIFLVDNDGGDAITGTFAGLAQGAKFTSGGVEFFISYTGDLASGIFAGAGNDVVIMVPEPGTIVQTGLALGLLVAIQRTRRRCSGRAA